MIRCACGLPLNSFSFASALYVRHSCYYHNSMNALKVKCLHMYHVRASQHIYIQKPFNLSICLESITRISEGLKAFIFGLQFLVPWVLNDQLNLSFPVFGQFFSEFYIILWLLKGFFDRKIHSHTRVLDWIHDFISTLA